MSAALQQVAPFANEPDDYSSVIIFSPGERLLAPVRQAFVTAKRASRFQCCGALEDYGDVLLEQQTLDAVIVDGVMAPAEIEAALRHTSALRPGMITFVLFGDAIEDLDTTRRDGFVKDDELEALPYVIDRIRQERQQAQIAKCALSENERQFEELAARLDDVLWICTADAKRILYLSPAFNRVWGVDETAFYRRPSLWLHHIHPEDRARFLAEFTGKALKGQEYSIDYRILHSNGSTRHVRDRSYPIFDRHGVLKKICGIAHDCTQEKQIEEEMRLSHRLEAVGQLATGIAHEINTPAQFIGDNLRFLQDGATTAIKLIDQIVDFTRKLDIPCLSEAVARACASADYDYLRTEMPLAIAQSNDGIQRISTIVRAMKDFSHPGASEPEPADLNEIIRSAITVTRNEWKYSAELISELDASIPLVTCHGQAISQVLVNLIVNAAHAIEARGQKESKGVIRVSSQLIGDHVEVAIADSGCGIPESIRGRVFDQFFTTKDVGKGTGQGLAMAWNTIVEGHHGRLDFTSVVDTGTTFIFKIPVVGS